MKNLLKPGQPRDLPVPTNLTIRAGSLSKGMELYVLLCSTNASGTCVPGIAEAMRLTPENREDVFSIDVMPADTRLQIIVAAVLDATEISLERVGALEVWIEHAKIVQASTDYQVALLGEMYEKNGMRRFRFVDQGWTCTFDVWAAERSFDHTLADIQSVFGTVVNDPVSPTKASDPLPEAAGQAHSRVLRLSYKAKEGGTSHRLIVVTSVQNDRFRAREEDGKQVKTFLIDGVLELVDSETGEDMLLPLLAARSFFVSRS